MNTKLSGAGTETHHCKGINFVPTSKSRLSIYGNYSDPNT